MSYTIKTLNPKTLSVGNNVDFGRKLNPSGQNEPFNHNYIYKKDGIYYFIYNYDVTLSGYRYMGLEEYQSLDGVNWTSPSGTQQGFTVYMRGIARWIEDDEDIYITKYIIPSGGVNANWVLDQLEEDEDSYPSFRQDGLTLTRNYPFDLFKLNDEYYGLFKKIQITITDGIITELETQVVVGKFGEGLLTDEVDAKDINLTQIYIGLNLDPEVEGFPDEIEDISINSGLVYNDKYYFLYVEPDPYDVILGEFDGTQINEKVRWTKEEWGYGDNPSITEPRFWNRGMFLKNDVLIILEYYPDSITRIIKYPDFSKFGKTIYPNKISGWENASNITSICEEDDPNDLRYIITQSPNFQCSQVYRNGAILKREDLDIQISISNNYFGIGNIILTCDNNQFLHRCYKFENVSGYLTSASTNSEFIPNNFIGGGATLEPYKAKFILDENSNMEIKFGQFVKIYNSDEVVHVDEDFDEYATLETEDPTTWASALEVDYLFIDGEVNLTEVDGVDVNSITLIKEVSDVSKLVIFTPTADISYVQTRPFSIFESFKLDLINLIFPSPNFQIEIYDTNTQNLEHTIKFGGDDVGEFYYMEVDGVGASTDLIDNTDTYTFSIILNKNLNTYYVELDGTINTKVDLDFNPNINNVYFIIRNHTDVFDEMGFSPISGFEEILITTDHHLIVDGAYSIANSRVKQREYTIVGKELIDLEYEIEEDWVDMKMHEILNEIFEKHLNFLRGTFIDDSYSAINYSSRSTKFSRILEDFQNIEYKIFMFDQDGLSLFRNNILSANPELTLNYNNIVSIRPQFISRPVTIINLRGAKMDGEYIRAQWIETERIIESEHILFQDFPKITSVNELQNIADEIGEQRRDQQQKLTLEIETDLKILRHGDIVEVSYGLENIGTDEDEPLTYINFWIEKFIENEFGCFRIECKSAFIFEEKKTSYERNRELIEITEERITGQLFTLDDNVVKLTGNQTIQGVKTFDDKIIGDGGLDLPNASGVSDMLEIGNQHMISEHDNQLTMYCNLASSGGFKVRGHTNKSDYNTQMLINDTLARFYRYVFCDGGSSFNEQLRIRRDHLFGGRVVWGLAPSSDVTGYTSRNALRFVSDGVSHASVTSSGDFSTTGNIFEEWSGGGYNYLQTSYERTTSSGANMNVISNGNVRRSTSSRKYKKNISSLHLDSSLIYQLQPVSFQSKCEMDNQEIWRIGLIAEDVDEICPQLVFHENICRENEEDPNSAITNPETAGQPEGVKYELISVLLIEEIKKLKKEIKKIKDKYNELIDELNSIKESLK